MKKQFFLSALLSLCTLACQQASTTLSDAHSEHRIFEITQDNIHQELSSSSIHELQIPFNRIGVMFEASQDNVNVDISVSEDGHHWSSFKPVSVVSVQKEDIVSYVGRYDVQIGTYPRYFKIKAHENSILPEHIMFEFLDMDTQSSAATNEHLQSEMSQDSASLELNPSTNNQTSALWLGKVWIQPRSSWGAKDPSCISYHRPYRMSIHNTESANNSKKTPIQQIKDIQTYHMDVKGWCDIGYHYLVTRDGQIFEGRPVERLGTHVANGNAGNVGIAFVGTYMTLAVNDEQVKNSAQLIRALSDKYKITINRTNIKGHREQNDTDCPGDALYKQIDSILALARSLNPSK